MVGNEPRVTLAQVIRTVRPIGDGLAATRRAPAASEGVLAAVACVAIAVVLYAIVTLVWGTSDDGELSFSPSPVVVAAHCTSRLDGLVSP